MNVDKKFQKSILNKSQENHVSLKKVQTEKKLEMLKIKID